MTCTFVLIFTIRVNSWQWIVLKAIKTVWSSREENRLGQIPDMIHKLVLPIVEELARYRAGPDVKNTIDHMFDEDAGGGVAVVFFSPSSLSIPPDRCLCTLLY